MNDGSTLVFMKVSGFDGCFINRVINGLCDGGGNYGYRFLFEGRS